jgi:hypothetical protein
VRRRRLTRGTKAVRFSAITERGRHAQAVPEHQKKQQATVAGLIAATSGGFDEAFNLARGKVLAVAKAAPGVPIAAPVARAGIFGSAPVYHFVESLGCRKWQKPL